jgi:hypothetical protein
LNESIFEETATAVSFREIRQRDPSFSLPDFAGDVQEMIKPVLTAYSKGDVKTLKKYCTKEVIERCKGERDAYASQGIFFDHKVGTSSVLYLATFPVLQFSFCKLQIKHMPSLVFSQFKPHSVDLDSFM